MGRFFIPRHWRLPMVMWGIIIFEFPFTVANLTLFGIAQPNLYRTILWKQGGDMGFNSDPSTVAYAAYNYKPVSTPMVWSQFMTNYNVDIGVFCMFLWLVKCTMYALHWFYPIIALPVYLTELVLWAYSIYCQTAPDTIDPKRQNKGAPWYITHNCNIVSDKNIRGYCMQAKSSFAVSIVMLVIMVAALLLTCYSLYPTRAARQIHEHKMAEKKADKEKWEALTSPTYKEMSAEEQWQHMWELQQLPRTPGTAGGMKSPTTPRTLAFKALDGEAAERGFTTSKTNGQPGSGVPPGWIPAPSSYYAPEQDIPRTPALPQQYQYPAPAMTGVQQGQQGQDEIQQVYENGNGKGHAY